MRLFGKKQDRQKLLAVSMKYTLIMFRQKSYAPFSGLAWLAGWGINELGNGWMHEISRI